MIFDMHACMPSLAQCSVSLHVEGYCQFRFLSTILFFPKNTNYHLPLHFQNNCIDNSSALLGKFIDLFVCNLEKYRLMNLFQHMLWFSNK